MKQINKAVFVLYATSFLAAARSVHAQKAITTAKPSSRSTGIAAVISAEHAFARMATDSGAQPAFDKYLAADATIFRPRAQRAFDYRSRHPLPANVILTWEPSFADISSGGDFAYTTGPYASGARGGRSDERFGEYVTVWRKQKDGRWLAIFNGSILTPVDLGPQKKLKSPVVASGYVAKAPIDEKNTLLNADNTFATIVKQRGYGEALKPVALAEMRLLRNTVPTTVGMDSIMPSVKGARVTMWMPVEAIVATAGDLGYTRGSYVVSLPTGRIEAGDYIRIWRRDRNGTWLIALDMLSPGR